MLVWGLKRETSTFQKGGHIFIVQLQSDYSHKVLRFCPSIIFKEGGEYIFFFFAYFVMDTWKCSLECGHDFPPLRWEHRRKARKKIFCRVFCPMKYEWMNEWNIKFKTWVGGCGRRESFQCESFPSTDWERKYGGRRKMRDREKTSRLHCGLQNSNGKKEK